MSLDQRRYRSAIDTALDAWIKDAPEDIGTQLRTIVSTYDDRFRGNLLLASYDAVTPPRAAAEDVVSGAVAVELLHAYLISRRWLLRSDDVSERFGSALRWDTKTTLRTGNYALLHTVLKISSLAEDTRQQDCLQTVSTALKSLWKTLTTEQELITTKEITDEEFLQLLENGPLLQTATAAKLGATLSGANPEVCERWQQFGHEFGKAVVLCEATVAPPHSVTTQLRTNVRAQPSPDTMNELETQKSDSHCSPQMTVHSPYDITKLTGSVRRNQQREGIRRAREILAEVATSPVRDDLDNILVQLSADTHSSGNMAR